MTKQIKVILKIVRNGNGVVITPEMEIIRKVIFYVDLLKLDIMKTFISWIIANFEGVIFCIIFSIIAIFLFSNPPIKDDGTIISHKGLLELLILSAVFIGGLTLQTKNAGVGIIKYLLIVAFLIWRPGLDDSLIQNFLSWTFLWILFIGSSVIGLISAIYAFLNFDDVVSLRIILKIGWFIMILKL